MSGGIPTVPVGDGKHPISLVVIGTTDLADGARFYSTVFGWEAQPMGPELTSCFLPGGPIVALRANMPEGAPIVTPYLQARDVQAALDGAVTAGGQVERAPWAVPANGVMARFREPSGTIYGLTTLSDPRGASYIAMPMGDNPKPAENALCSIEMYSADRARTAQFLTAVFGWGAQETMPNYTAFDPGAGIGGVLQSHTSATPAMAYIYSLNVAAKLAEIVAAGGKSFGDPMAMPGMATFGYFSDPSGVSVGLIGPA